VRHGRARYDTELVIEQGAEISRPSILYVRVRGDGRVAERIEVGGQVVVIGRGELRL
jgi:predicted PhzF superfamily epimerase YddE/YHI9